MIEDLNYNYEFIVQAKLGAYHDIRKCLYLDKCVLAAKRETSAMRIIILAMIIAFQN